MPDFRFEAIGTAWTVSTAGPLDSALKTRILDRVERYDRAFSRFRPDSLVTALARQGSALFPPEAGRLLDLFDQLVRLSGGRLNPLAGASLERLGYDAGYSLVPSGPPLAAPPWHLLERKRTGRGVLLRSPEPVVLDVGAAGKGQLVDLVAAELADAGIGEYLVDAGSDMLRRGDGAVPVALEHPFDPSRAVGVLNLQAGALCASATGRRAWGEGLHHVLDAATGRPVTTVVAAWAVAAQAMVADGLATALFLAEPETLRSAFRFDYVRIFSDGRAQFSDALAGVLFP